jgi:hypothetical protein
MATDAMAYFSGSPAIGLQQQSQEQKSNGSRCTLATRPFRSSSMRDENNDKPTPHDNREKDPDDWVTGDESMTGPQRSYLETLCREAGEPFDPTLSKAQASERIDELQKKTGRGRDH